MAESELIRIAFKQVNDTWEIMAETNPELYYAVEHCINDHTSKTILKMKLMDPYGLELPEMNHIAINGGVALDKFVSRMIFGKEM